MADLISILTAEGPHYWTYCNEAAYLAYRAFPVPLLPWGYYEFDQNGRITNLKRGEVHCRFKVDDPRPPRAEIRGVGGWSMCAKWSENFIEHWCHLLNDHHVDRDGMALSVRSTPEAVRDYYHSLMVSTVQECGPLPIPAYMDFWRTFGQPPLNLILPDPARRASVNRAPATRAPVICAPAIRAPSEAEPRDWNSRSVGVGANGGAEIAAHCRVPSSSRPSESMVLPLHIASNQAIRDQHVAQARVDVTQNARALGEVGDEPPPMVKKEATVVKKKPPVTKKRALHPVVKEKASLVKKEVSVIKHEAAVVKKEAVVVKNEAPVVKEEAPEVKEEETHPVVKKRKITVKVEEQD